MSSDKSPRTGRPLLKHRVIVLLTEKDLAALDQIRRLDDRSRSGMIRHALRQLAKAKHHQSQRHGDLGGKD